MPVPAFFAPEPDGVRLDESTGFLLLSAALQPDVDLTPLNATATSRYGVTDLAQLAHTVAAHPATTPAGREAHRTVERMAVVDTMLQGSRLLGVDAFADGVA